MPSSGHGIGVDLLTSIKDPGQAKFVEDAAKAAIHAGVFLEWLGSFVDTWHETKDPVESAQAGLTEWDIAIDSRRLSARLESLHEDEDDGG
jgi:hypothetical protein